LATVYKLLDLSGRRALITGAGGKLGTTMALTLAELGVDLVLTDRISTPLDKLQCEIKKIGKASVEFLYCDLEYHDDREGLIHHLNKQGRLDILINNAAYIGTAEFEGWAVPFSNQSLEAWNRALEVNLTAVFHLCQGLAPLLEKYGHGSVINVASIYGLLGPDWALYEETEMGNPAAYGVTKAGLIQFTRWLATTIAPRFRVNAISPGGIERGQPAEFIKRYEARTPLGRMARESDFRGITAFLASDMSSYITGQNFVVDGGWTSW
jgi:NAD(P)-dependent dehydrogenase (short-subunit alcohol dehydrogenase family)